MREYELSNAHWFKSSYSNGSGGDCVEVTYDFAGATWRKSSYSNGEGGECVEITHDFVGIVPVRDSKVTDGPVLVVPAAAWAAFVDGIVR
ncbi:DUF397 domain-containing protein [Streptomyces sp. SP18ES09]|uniref:DUF397 domain-containing protein n=1 Tax=Streptomyces sp. SP18ES09 TaxID=3002532 RepID=UPI002E785132|nr:DUF397 domain-containing protein [Streptomyces sp. SP18ES09]MEE1818175.1 DUF397 domain-containing protein [Streptomyces sp. SP18ES09]